MDISIYNRDTSLITCPRLLITLPGFGYPIMYEMTPGFNRAFNAIDLTIQSNYNHADTVNLPDGIYILNYSIAPNEDVFVEYNHLRQVEAYCMYYAKVCALDLNPCNICGNRKDKIKKLQDIKFLLEAAKAYVEECGAPKKGLELHNYAVSLLQNLEVGCDSCNTCS